MYMLKVSLFKSTISMPTSSTATTTSPTISLTKTTSTRNLENAFNASDFEDAIGACWDQLELAANDGQSIITCLDTEYPVKLKELSDPPLVVYYRGNKALLHETLPAIAVVGSRKASDYGLRVAWRFGEALAEAGATVVSGLAIGCDERAPEGCLAKDGATIAVLPSSLDKVVPEQNAGLADRIVVGQGLLVSERPPLTMVDKSAFVRRNRIQAALADKLIIVETAVDGGTMRTVGFAKKLEKPIGAYSFPEKYRTASCKGNDVLIQEGTAIPLHDTGSIEAFLNTAELKLGDQLPLELGEWA